MPELPEIETTKEGIKNYLEGYIIERVIIRNAKLRIPVPPTIHEQCIKKTILEVNRRAKYLLIHLNQGVLLIHLGMSGHLRIVPYNTPPGKHDHIDLCLNNQSILRYCDPRRFGLFYYIEDEPYQHALLRHLGPEPLSKAFDADYLYQKIQKKTQPIKAWIMNNHLVVGIGNIYATESLFLARIHPMSPSCTLSYQQCELLTEKIKAVLTAAINAGGTTLKDFYSAEGTPGYFSIALQIYGRKNQPCLHCKSIIDSVMITGRSSAFCPQCQSRQSPELHVLS